MSKIQRALERVQREDKLRGSAPSSPSPESLTPIPRKKTVVFEGDKHHVDQAQLIRGGLLAPLDKAIPVAGEFRRIKRPLLDNAAADLSTAHNEHMNVIMVASALPGVGKTFCSVNLAASISLERELNVLLIDTDVAKPHISSAFGLGERRGLLDLLIDDSLGIEDVIVRTDLNDMQVLPAGTKHSQSTELLASDKMAEVLHEVATRYHDRIIVMDSPPLLLTSEAPAVARQAGQIALVIESGKTTTSAIEDALELLDNDKAINIILNKSLHSQRGGYYGSNDVEYGDYHFNEEHGKRDAQNAGE